MSQQVSLEILEPRGVLENPKREGLFAPRLSSLNGKTIALMGINIPVFHSSSEPFFEVVERKLRERYPEVKILRMNSFGTPIDPPEKAYEVAEKCDAWLEGVKDSHTQGRHDAGVCMERAGRPGVSICVDVLRRAKEAGQDLYGMPKVRIVTVPAADYNSAKDDPQLMERVVDGCIDDIIEGLTKPLTEEEKRSSTSPSTIPPRPSAAGATVKPMRNLWNTAWMAIWGTAWPWRPLRRRPWSGCSAAPPTRGTRSSA